MRHFLLPRGSLGREAAPSRVYAVLVVACAVLPIACGGSGSDAGLAIGAERLVGTWRAVFLSPGGELPFMLRVNPVGSEVPAVAINGGDETPFTSITAEGSAYVLRIDYYDSEIVAKLSPSGEGLSGFWRQTVRNRISQLPFSAVKGDTRRFLPDDPPAGDAIPESAKAVASVEGTWAVVFNPDERPSPGRGEFRQEGDRVTGTFIRPSSDHRFLEGDYRDGILRLSVFDGGHAFLYRARAMPDGGLQGDFWSRDLYHSTWTARRIDPITGDDGMPDAFDMVGISNDEGRLDFSFPDLDGTPVSLSDSRFEGCVVLVNLFGSWCPNCHDEAPLLADWHRRYRDRGLEIVGLAFEVSEDLERSRRFVRAYADRHGIEFPLLLAGTDDKEEASRLLPDLTEVAAFPTTIFVGRDGRVRSIHSGFVGPGAGEHHRRLVAELEAIIEGLLAEAGPDSAS